MQRNPVTTQAVQRALFFLGHKTHSQIGFSFRRQVESSGRRSRLATEATGAEIEQRRAGAENRAFLVAEICFNAYHRGFAFIPHLGNSARHGQFGFWWQWPVNLDALFTVEQTGNVEFNYSDLVCVILPEEGNGPLKFGLAQKGISWVSPEWGLERIVEELSDQQNRTRRLNRPVEKPMISRSLKV